MTSDPSPNRDELDPGRWDIFRQSENGLRAMLRHRLSDPGDIDDCVQAVLVKWIERGNDVLPAASRAWLFRVAANEAAWLWRRREVADRANRSIAEQSDEPLGNRPVDHVTARESSEDLRRALEKLSPEQSEALRLRFEHDLSFAEIAQQCGIPLGTALTRVRRALIKLRNDRQLREALGEESPDRTNESPDGLPDDR